MRRGSTPGSPCSGRCCSSSSSGSASTFVSRSNEIHFLNALVAVAIVVAIYVFVGNSGVLSFGQISFVARRRVRRRRDDGAARVEDGRPARPLPAPARPHDRQRRLARARGRGRRRLRVPRRPAADAPVRARGRDRDLRRARDHAQPAARVDEDRPGRDDALARARDDRRAAGDRRALLVVVVVAFAYQRSPLGRKARATREDPAAAQAVGISVHRQRLWAFTLSGALCGFAGGLLVHMLGSITTEQVYLELTFLTLAMLVVGGVTSLWGAVVGALAVSGLDSRARERRGRDRRRLHARPARGVAAGHTRRADGAGADPAPVRAHRRPRAAAAAEGRHEGLRRRLRGRRARCSRPTSPRSRTSRCGRTTSRATHVDAINAHGLRLSGAGEVHATGIRATADAAELPAVRLRDRGDEGDAHRGGDRRHRARVRGRRRRLGPERRRQRGGDRAARRARDPRHDLPGREDPRAGRRAVGRQGRHDVRPVRAEPGERATRSSASPTPARAAACRRRRSPTRAAPSGGR